MRDADQVPSRSGSLTLVLQNQPLRLTAPPSGETHCPAPPFLQSSAWAERVGNHQILLLGASPPGALLEYLIRDFPRLRAALYISPNAKEKLYSEIQTKDNRCTRFIDVQETLFQTLLRIQSMDWIF